MSEKISEEMVREIISAAFPASDGPLLDYMVENVRAAGLLEPEEDALEKARKIRNTILNCNDYQNDFGQLELASLDMADAYEAAITRLKASAWTPELVKEYGGYCYGKGEEGNSFYFPESWLNQRKDGTT